jgi:hypothetical protein
MQSSRNRRSRSTRPRSEMKRVSDNVAGTQCRGAFPTILRGGVPTYQVEDEEGRTHLLIHLPIDPFSG